MRTPPFFQPLLFVLFFFVQLLIGSSIYPQTNFTQKRNPLQQEHSPVLLKDLNHFLNTGLVLSRAPLSFTASDWRNTSLAFGTTVLLFTTDKTARQAALFNRNRFNDNLFYFDHFYGDVYEFGFTAALYAGGYISGNQKIRLIGLHSIEAFLYAGAISSMIKFIAGRRRPNGGESNLVFKPFNFDNVYNSLPSGHATAAFAVSTVMAKSVENTYWDHFWYGIAAITGTSRIYHNQHWLSDVFLGSVLGYSVASYIVKQDSNLSEKQTPAGNFTISQYIANGSVGICLRF
ncbi:MAG: phosphatase PAP2 family protein [Calditrichia bacterium]